MSDRQERTRQHLTTIGSKTRTAIELLMAARTNIAAIPTPPRPERLVRAPGTSDPTSAQLVGGEMALEGHLTRLAMLLNNLRWCHKQQGCDLTSPLDAWMLLNDEELRPATSSRGYIKMLQGLQHMADEMVWDLETVGQELADRQWIDTGKGKVLDETAEVRHMALTNDLEDLARQARRLVNGIRPPSPSQKPLVWCKHHPDRLAKYRRKELCEACYKRQQRAS